MSGMESRNPSSHYPYPSANLKVYQSNSSYKPSYSPYPISQTESRTFPSQYSTLVSRKYPSYDSPPTEVSEKNFPPKPTSYPEKQYGNISPYRQSRSPSWDSTWNRQYPGEKISDAREEPKSYHDPSRRVKSGTSEDYYNMSVFEKEYSYKKERSRHSKPRSSSKSKESRKSHKKKSKRRNRSRSRTKSRKMKHFSMSSDEDTRESDSRLLFDPNRIPTPPPPPILSGFQKEDEKAKTNIKRPKDKFQAPVDNENVSLSCLLEAVMEHTDPVSVYLTDIQMDWRGYRCSCLQSIPPFMSRRSVEVSQ